MLGGVVQFKRKLAGKAEAEHLAGRTGHFGFEVAEPARRIFQPGFGQELFGQWPGDVNRAQGHRLVQDAHVHLPAFGPVAQPHLGMADAAAGEGEAVASVALFANQAVVENVAAFIEEEDLAGTAVPNGGDFGGVEPFQKL
jgi:hypothetical protein